MQIRQSWDQGSLLKLIDVIGKTGRNWPIRDGKDQINLIINSVNSAGKIEPEKPAHIRSRGNSTNATRDPYASVALFAPRERVQEDLPNVIAPKGKTLSKPSERAYNDLFNAEDSDTESRNTSSRASDRADSPSKNPRAPKIGANKNYAPSRLFETQETNLATEKIYRPNAARYNHFELADGGDDDTKAKPEKGVRAAKHGSNWNFDDFQTPQKVIPTKVLRANEVRHWGNSDDENMNTPAVVRKVDKPRKDAKPHFEFNDEGTPANERRLIGRPRGQGQTSGMGLYKNDMFDDDETVQASKPTIANTKERNKMFDPHFAMTDDSPASKPAAAPLTEDPNRAKAVKMMNANWDTYDQSPNQKENVPSNGGARPSGDIKTPLAESKSINRAEKNKGIVIAGDGMGGKKGTAALGEKSKAIAVGGDGMGGKKGKGRSWGFGDESDGEEVGGRNQPQKFQSSKIQRQQATGGDFWDF